MVDRERGFAGEAIEIALARGTQTRVLLIVDQPAPPQAIELAECRAQFVG
jgi:hypothetical protein